MKLTIYMKSGNAIVTTGVKEYEIENKGNEIVGLKLVYLPELVLKATFRKKLLVKTVDLSQIEAVVRS